MSKTQIDIAEVERLLEREREINRIPLEDIEWMRDGVKVEIPQTWIDDWKFVGLCNVSFIETGAYRTGPTT